jgi:hypothetical protein
LEFRQLWTNSSEKATLDSSGNLGLGVTPSASWTGGANLQIGLGAVYANSSLGACDVSYNSVRTASNSYVYAQTGLNATRLQQRDGAFNFFTALSGTAGNPISFTQAMTLDASGNLGIGATSPLAKLDVVGGDGDGIQYRTGTRTVGIGQVASEAAVYWGSTTALTFFSGTERMRLDSSGNLGLGVTPSAWTSYKALQVASTGLRFPQALPRIWKSQQTPTTTPGGCRRALGSTLVGIGLTLALTLGSPPPPAQQATPSASRRR